MIIVNFYKSKKGLKSLEPSNPFYIVVSKLFWIIQLASFFTVAKVYDKPNSQPAN